MEQEQFTYLFDRYFSRQATPEETESFFSYVRNAEHDDDLKKRILQTWDAQIPGYQQPDENADAIFNAIINMPEAGRVKVRTMVPWRRIAVAASVLIVIAVGIKFGLSKGDNKEAEIVKTFPSDVQAPHNTKAIITLADGRVVAIDSLTTIRQGNVNVIKNEKGEIIYDGSQPSSATDGSQLVYNTLENPRGSKVIDMTLADGSRVWLNAGSSVTYPVAFVGNERKVEITGEAYFEVTKDPSKKFIVSSNSVNTEVLGTHFNVNTYVDEENSRVTLLEGSVRVIPTFGKDKAKVLKPGEQAQINHAALVQVVNNIDLEKTMAWKNNEFIFENDDLRTIMLQLSRWYDIQPVFKTNDPTQYTGRITRTVPVSQVLTMFEKLGYVKFEIKGKDVTILATK